jgi:hypothetical protein
LLSTVLSQKNISLQGKYSLHRFKINDVHMTPSLAIKCCGVLSVRTSVSKVNGSERNFLYNTRSLRAVFINEHAKMFFYVGQFRIWSL